MSNEQVASIVQRVQRLQEEKRTIEEDIREVYQEARANGYDVKVLRAVVKHLGKDENEVAEFDAIFELYLQAFRDAVAPSRDAGRATPARAIAVPAYPEHASRPAPTSEPDETPAGAVVAMPNGATARDTAAAPETRATFVLPTAKPLRPHCQSPDRCGSYGSKHCDACIEAAGLTEARAYA